MELRFVLLGCALVLGGCGGDDGDAAAGESGDCAPGEWRRDDGLCVPPGLPPDMPCPPGEWLREADGVCIPAGVPPDGCGEGFEHDGDRGCEPILPDTECPDGLMAVPGDTQCREVAACASGPYGDIPVEPDIEHVDAGYTGGSSNGTQAAPWTTIQAGTDAALPGAIVAVAAGSYVEDVVLQGKPVRLWGKCPALVELTSTDAGFAALLISTGANGSEVRRLSISGQGLGVYLSGSEDVLLDELLVHGNGGHGVEAADSYGPTSVVVKRSLVEGNYEVGVYVWGSEATVEAAVVRNTLPDTQGVFGHGISVVNDPATGARASVTVVRSLLEKNQQVGVSVFGADATVEATVVRGTLPDAQGLLGDGISVSNDATRARSSIAVLRSLLEKNQEVGLFVGGSDATVDATVVRDTLPNARGVYGHGINIANDLVTGARASATVQRSLLARNQQIGIVVSGSDATVEATVVRDTLPNAQGIAGRAVEVQFGTETGAAASATLRACVLERSIEAAVFVHGPATAELEACLLRDTVVNGMGILGDGLVVWSYAGLGSATVTATRIEASQRAAVSSFGAKVGLQSSLLMCQGFDIGSEIWEGQVPVFDDRGGMLCGCPEATEPCKAQSYSLAPPPPE